MDTAQTLLNLCGAIAIFGIPCTCRGLRASGLSWLDVLISVGIALITLTAALGLAYVVQTGGDIITQSSLTRQYLRYYFGAMLLLGSSALGEFVTREMGYTAEQAALAFSCAFLILSVITALNYVRVIQKKRAATE